MTKRIHIMAIGIAAASMLALVSTSNAWANGEEAPPPPPAPVPPPVVEPSGWRFEPYLGGGVGVVSWDGCEGSNFEAPPFERGCQADVITGHELGAKGFAGLRFHDFAAVEAGFHWFGESEDDDANEGRGPDTYEAYGASFSVLGILPLTRDVEAFLKAGVVYGWLEQHERNDENDVHDSDGISPLLGGGVSVNLIDGLAARAEVEWVHNVGDGDSVDNDLSDNEGRNNETGDVDVVATTMSVVWTPGGGDGRPGLLDGLPATSAETGFYVGAGASLVNHDGCEDARGEDSDLPGSCEDNISDITYGGKAFAGWRFHENAAIETAFHYFSDGEDDDSNFADDDSGTATERDSFESYGASLSLLGILPVDDRVSVFLKGGGIYGWMHEDENFPGEPDNDDEGLSWLVGGGATVDITEDISVRAEVEYIDDIAQGNKRVIEEDGVDEDDTDAGHDDIIAATLSLVWNFGRAAAPVPVAAPAPAPAPMPRDFIVFFDWDNDQLTAEAQTVVADAALYALQGGTANVLVTGHTDTSGSRSYNLGLSKRRAETVAVALVGHGVPGQAIATAWEGESNPLVATGDGVREPQNRRVHIGLL